MSVTGYPLTWPAGWKRTAPDRRRAQFGTVREVLEIPAHVVDVELTEALVVARYRRLASLHHPDRPGGDAARFAEITRARDQALDALAAARPPAARG